jgi:phosphatidate cytidylyltransferase
MIRVVSGAVLVAIVIGVVWFASPLIFLFVAALVLVLGCVEYVRLARAGGLEVAIAPATLGAALIAAAVVYRSPGKLELALITTFIGCASVTLAGFRGGADALSRAAAAVFPALYLGVPIGAMAVTRDLYGGREKLFLMMLTVAVSDTGQYYTGRLFGRHLLAPIISPKKTIEGAAGGFLFGAAFMAIAGAWWLPALSPGARVLLGAVVVALGIAGDLFESMLKRGAGVKDSSSLIPGHGGILDRIDALLFAAPVYYVVVNLV